MRRFSICILLLFGSSLINATASERTILAAANTYAFQVEDEDMIIEDADAQVSDEPLANDVAYNEYAYSNHSSKKKYAKKHRSRGGGFASSRPGTGRTVFIFNPNSLTWAVYDTSGNLIRTGHGSGGRKYCPDIRRGCKTPSGRFTIIGKAGPGFRSSRYPLPGGGAPMPYAMFFSKFYAIHGSNDVPGYNASHGCIRVYTSDARWLSQNVIRHGTTVIVHPY